MSEIGLSPTGRTGMMAGDAPAQSAVAWGAVFAGGVACAALAIILSILGVGLGLASLSPWRGEGLSPTGFTVWAAVWLIIVQWVSSFFGGFIAGRLRTKWVAVHTDEVGFRDTAHGFLAWGLALLFTAGALALAGAGATGIGGQVAAKAASSAGAENYYVSELFRPVPGVASANGVSMPGVTSMQLREDATAILARAAVTGSASQADQGYLTQLVAAGTGQDAATAQVQVNDVLNLEKADLIKARQLANAARKSASAAAIYTFFSALVGAFIAAVAGLIGGRIRDRY
ncbi:MAG: hypothetical protein KGQ26_03600 [Rhodospirillales bacterium]|nr:hypothetical protein [Rhodospirillales bacterium]MDE2319029.1 hypothetical protein [Rhodospirillales bacterium]